MRQSLQQVAGSLLDVVVPFPNNGDGKRATQLPGAGREQPNTSLLSTLDLISKEQEDTIAELRATDRAEVRAKRASFELAEQQAKIDGEREASRRFEEKAVWLASEIERVRSEKSRNSVPTGAAPMGPSPQPPQQQIPRPAEQAYHPAPPQPAPPMPEQYPSPHQNGQPVQPGPAYNPGPSYASWPTPENPGYVPSGNRQPYGQSGPQQHWQNQQPPASDVAYDQRQQPYPPYGQNPMGADPMRTRSAGHGEPLPMNDFDRQRAAGFERQSQFPAQEPVGHYQSSQQQPPRAAPISEPVAQPQASGGGLYGQNQPSAKMASPSAPKLDINAMIGSVLRAWKSIILLAIIGGVIAGAYAKTLPNSYEAWAELLIDPRDIKVVDSQLSPSGMGGETMIAYLESQLRIIESTSVLNPVIERENLMQDPEFLGAAGMPGFMESLLPGSSAAKEQKTRQHVLEKLQDTMSISRGSRTFIVSIGVTTEDPYKSARIANAITDVYLTEEAGARSRVARDASDSLTSKLDTLRGRVQKAEQKVANYRAENGLISSDGKLTDEVQLARLNDQLAIAKIELLNARTRMEQARSTDLSDVISGALPASLNSNTISQMRVRYGSLKSNSDKLGTKLGPKHPERIAASAELTSVRGQISQEIRRMIAGSSKDYQRAKKRLESLKSQVNTQKAASVGVGSSLIKLREYERELEAHKSVYENYLLRSRETNEQDGLTANNARIISKATPPLERAGPNRKFYAVAGLIAGGVLGLLLALIRGLFFNNARPREDYQPGREPRSFQNGLLNAGRKIFSGRQQQYQNPPQPSYPAGPSHPPDPRYAQPHSYSNRPATPYYPYKRY